MIGTLIKEKRLEKGLTQTELAELVGLRKQSLCRIEQERFSVRGDILEKIAEAMNTEIKLVDKNGSSQS